MPDRTEPAHDPRYPVGKFTPRPPITAEDLRFAIETIAEMPALLREALRGLTHEQLNTPYREGGWTVRQLVHHMADSHMTAFFRTRKALTEDWPELTGYSEKDFALLHDAIAPGEWSVDILEGLHARWVLLLQALSAEQFTKRGIRHAERGPMALDLLTMLYAWHSTHHVAHITHLRQQQGW